MADDKPVKNGGAAGADDDDAAEARRQQEFYDSVWAKCLAPATLLSCVTPGAVGVVRVNMLASLVPAEEVPLVMAFHSGAGAVAEMLVNGLCGRLSDTYGRKIFLVGSMAIFAGMQSLIAFSPLSMRLFLLNATIGQACHTVFFTIMQCGARLSPSASPLCDTSAHPRTRWLFSSEPR